MLINAKTKISQLLKHNPDALEAIITISPDFKKLRNPLIRKLMAARTTISMASKVGGCKPEDFFKVLAPLGFEADTNAVTNDDETTTEAVMPEYLQKLPSDKIVVFDVREMIQSGADPLRPIQEKVKQLEDGQALNIVNSFEPVPLIKVLEKQGFKSYVKTVAPDQIDTYFYKTEKGGEVNFEEKIETDPSDWDEIHARFEGKFREVDVRGMQMPMPRITINGELESLGDGEALYVYHHKVPVFLLSDLKEQNFDYRIKDVQEGEVYLMIFKKK